MKGKKSSIYTGKAKRKLTIVMTMLLCFCSTTIVFANPIAQPIISNKSDSGHVSGCMHNHDSGCYSITHTHSSSCFGTHYLDLSGSTSEYAMCPICNVVRYIYIETGSCLSCHAGYTSRSCYECSYDVYTGAQPGGSCGLTCSLPTQSLTCSKSTYANCILPSLTAAKCDGWTNAATTTIQLSGNNITQIKVGNGAFASGSKMVVSDNGIHAIQVKSSTGHIIRSDVEIKNFDRAKPNIPLFTVEN